MIDSLPILLSASGIALAYFQTERLANEKRVQAALESIKEAITETRKYLERENHERREREKELELSKLWSIASMKIEKINPELAARLRIKETYWENSAKLSRKEILQNGIALKQIEIAFQKLRPGK